jgi:hypothetical protein
VAESLYWRVKEESPEAAFLLAYVMRSNGVLIPRVDDDLALVRRENPGIWVSGIAHMLSPSVLSRAREALEAGDVLCGYQFHLGGCGATAVVFNSFSGFEEHLRSTRPGDMFNLVSVGQLAAQSALLDPTPSAVRKWLNHNPQAEVLLLDTSSRPSQVEVIWREREAEKDENIDRLFRPNEGLFAVPVTDEQEYFIDAKMPNEKAQIPVGGAY